jgi:hypothetical protein
MLKMKLLLVALFLFCGFVLANETYKTELSREALEAEMGRLEKEIDELRNVAQKMEKRETEKRRTEGKALYEKRRAEAEALEAEFAHGTILERLEREAPLDPHAYLEWIEAQEREYSPHVASFEAREAERLERAENGGEDTEEEAKRRAWLSGGRDLDEQGNPTKRQKMLDQWLSQIAPDRREFYRVPTEEEQVEEHRKHLDAQRRFRNQFANLGGFEPRTDEVTLAEAREVRATRAAQVPTHPHQRRRDDVSGILESGREVQLKQLRSRDLSQLARHVRRVELAKRHEKQDTDDAEVVDRRSTREERIRRRREDREAERAQLKTITDRKERRLAEKKLQKEKADEARIQSDIRMEELLQSEHTTDLLRGFTMLFSRYERDLLDMLDEEEREAYEKEKGVHVFNEDATKPEHPPREALHQALRRREAAFEKLKRDVARLDQVRHLFDLRHQAIHGHWAEE